MGEAIPLLAPYVPEKPLVYKQGQFISQQEWLAQCFQLAEQLPNQQYVVNLCHDRYYFLLLFAASLIRGKTSLLPPNRQHNTVNEIQADFTDSVCISDKAEEHREVEALSLQDFLRSPSAGTNFDIPSIPAKHWAAIAFTSGSTGKPTPIKKAWQTLVGTGKKIAARFNYASLSPTVLATVPSQHMYGMETTVMLCLHGHCVMSTAQPFYPEDIASSINQIEKPLILVTTPVHMHTLVESVAQITNDVAGVISATAPLSNELAGATEKLLRAPVYEIYGCTEAGSMATRQTTQTNAWLMLEGMSLKKAGEEIKIYGDQLTEVATIQDRINWLSEQKFEFIGRNNDMIILGGKRSSLTELNQKLLSVSGVEDAIVYLPEQQKKLLRPCAYVVSKLSVPEITQQVGQLMDPVFVPRPIRKVDNIPRNETGKVTQQALQELNRFFHESK